MMFFSLAILFFAYIINAQTPPSAAPPTAPSPPVSTCANIGGYDVTSASGATRVYHWQPSSETSTVSFSVCGSINTICGEPGQICSTEPSNCCGMCQSWSEADGTVGTCLGMLFIRINFVTLFFISSGKFSTSRFINGAVEVQYDNGKLQFILDIIW